MIEHYPTWRPELGALTAELVTAPNAATAAAYWVGQKYEGPSPVVVATYDPTMKKTEEWGVVFSEE